MNEPRRPVVPRTGLLAALAVLVALAPRPAAAGAPEAPVVREITVTGFTGDPATIKDILRTKEGARLDRTTLNEDLERLFKAGYLATLRLQEMANGVRVIIDVAANPRIRTLTVEGAGRSWDSKLRDELITRPGEAISAAVLKLPEDQQFRGDKERLRVWCQERGYRAVAVTSKATLVPETDQIDLTFTVDLGSKYQAWQMSFEGNAHIATGELVRRMHTRRDTLFTSRRYSDQALEEDIQTIQDYCRYKGYPNAKVSCRREFRGPKGNRVYLTIVVDEGKQFPTAAVAVNGNKAVSSETIVDAIPVKQGQAFSDEKLVEASQAIEKLYRNAGYPYVTITPTRELNAAGDAYDVAFNIDEGARITIHEVLTRGNARTRQDVILRELELQPGAVYDLQKLNASRRALERLGFFDKVTLSLQPTEPPIASERDLIVKVEERETGAFRFGLGFSTTNALVGAIELTQRNFDWRRTPKSWDDLFSGNAFVGAGQFFRVALMPGTIYSNYLIQYENPYWKHYEDGRNESFGWSLYWTTRNQDTWDERHAGLRLSWGQRKYKGDPDTDLIWHARIEAASVLNVDDDDAPEGARDDKGTHPVLGVGVTLVRDKTDSTYLPTTGVRWDAGPELVVPYGVRVGAGGAKYWPVGSHPKGHERVFSVRGRVDYELGDFPIFERLFAGSPLIRGFTYRGAGPHDNGEPNGGKYRAIVSTQYRYPLAANTFYGVVFADAGTVTDDFSVFGEPRLAAGFGFRLLLPKLSRVPLSLDFALPILKQSDDDTQVIYFSLALPWGGMGTSPRPRDREQEPATELEE